MRRFKYILSQSFKQVYRNKAMALASIFAITAMLLILGLFFAVIINVNITTEAIKKDYNSAEIFLKDDVKKEAALDIKKQVGSWENVKTARYKDKEEALKILKQRWGESAYLLDGLDSNPLPNSILVEMKDLAKAETVVKDAKNIQGVEDVKFYKDTVDKLLKTSNFMQIATIVVMIFLIIVSLVVVANTIKLTVINRAEEISIMKYIGATNWFIRGPFLVEGIILGTFSALIAAGIVAVVYGKVLSSIGSSVTAVLSMPLIPVGVLSLNLILIFLAIGVSIGTWGSIISMRRYLDT